MNHYETVFILTPVLSDAQMKEAVEKFKTVLTGEGATIVNEENWGLRKLAYPIQKKTTGFYTLIEFDGEPTIVKTIETAFRRDEKVIRFLVFHLDKFAAEYAAKRRSLRGAKEKENKTEKPAEEAKPVAEEKEAEVKAEATEVKTEE
jgi:small subunit ribosomal protein S6